MEHSGTYKIVFKNSAGSDESSAELNILGEANNINII